MLVDFQQLQDDVASIKGIVLALADRINQPPQLETTERPLSVKEAAEFLGRTEATLYGWIYEKRIPFHKPTGGGNLYFFQSELVDWIKNGQLRSKDELDEKARAIVEKRVKRRKGGVTK